jgi:hypothetical protein
MQKLCHPATDKPAQSLISAQEQAKRVTISASHAYRQSMTERNLPHGIPGESHAHRRFNGICLLGMFAVLIIIVVIFCVFAFTRRPPAPGPQGRQQESTTSQMTKPHPTPQERSTP